MVVEVVVGVDMVVVIEMVMVEVWVVDGVLVCMFSITVG